MSLVRWNKSLRIELDEIKSKFPDGGRVLDLGAGTGSSKQLFGENWEWIGIDIYPEHESVIKEDAHNLSFQDDYFDLIISIAVFEHLHSPWIAIKEISRVMKKGAFFLGTVAFLEPEHGNSYFHMTKRGMSQILKVGSLREVSVEPTEGWNVLTSMKMFPIPGVKYYNKLKAKLVFSMRSLLIRIRLLTLKGERKKRGLELYNTDKYRYSGSFRFLAQK